MSLLKTILVFGLLTAITCCKGQMKTGQVAESCAATMAKHSQTFLLLFGGFKRYPV